RAMRATGDDTPVLFLSAKGEPQERVMGLEAGGDDYLAKPFYLPEFLVRVRGLLHRSARYHPMGSLLSFGGHQVDLRGWTVRLRDGREEALGERELGILQLLARRRNEVVSRDDILDSFWG